MIGTYILIIISLVQTSGTRDNTLVTTQEFSSVEACRFAATEIARQNNNHGKVRMSCVPKFKE